MRVLQVSSAAVVKSYHISLSKPLSLVSASASVPRTRIPAVISLSSRHFIAGPSLPSLRARSTSGRAVSESKGGRKELVCMAAASAPVEVLVKAAVGHPDQLGDCPFSQRVLLTLEEKGIPYEATYIDASNKPAWFLEANPEGKVPVVKHDGKWVADSDVITELLEKKYPDPPVAGPAPPVGGKLFGGFVQFLTSKDPSDGKEEAFLGELKALDTWLGEHGPYLNGEKITAPDLALAPKLYHIKIALGHYKKWTIPSDLTHLNKYIEAVHARESFVKTAAPQEFVVKGWESKVLGA